MTDENTAEYDDTPPEVKRLYNHVAQVDETDSELADVLGTLAENRRAYLNGDGVSLPEYSLGDEDATATVGTAVRFGVLLERAASAASKPGNEPTPDEDILEDLRHVAAVAGRRPRVADVRDYGEYSYSLYHDRFGGIIDAADEANADPRSEDWEPPEGYEDTDDNALGEEERRTCRFCGEVYKRIPSHLPDCDGIDDSPELEGL